MLQDAPLFGTNAYYIALNDNDTPVGKQWRAYDLVNAPQVRAFGSFFYINLVIACSAPTLTQDYVVDIDQPSIKNIVSKVGQRRENLPERFVGRIVASKQPKKKRQRESVVVFSIVHLFFFFLETNLVHFRASNAVGFVLSLTI